MFTECSLHVRVGWARQVRLGLGPSLVSADLKALARVFTLLRVGQDEAILIEGERVQMVLFILQGEVLQEKIRPSGKVVPVSE
jgi:hypothetical protein